MLSNRKPDQWWVEPFVGGGNMIDKVSGNRMGADIHPYLISLLIAVQAGYIPPTEVSQEMYYEIKAAPHMYPPELVGFVGFLCSFGGKWWGGFARNKRGDNYATQGGKNILRQKKSLEGAILLCCDYRKLEIPDNSIIYCDPPYQDTTKYDTHFNHAEFWQWCRDKATAGHTVFVSEYNAPSDFECLVSIDFYTALNRNIKKPRTEKLFIYKV